MTGPAGSLVGWKVMRCKGVRMPCATTAGQELLYDYGPNYPIALLQPTAPIKGSEEAAAA
jgi:hypothetical protein